MNKKYIGMAFPSDGLNDSEYWKILPKNFELLISRYEVSGSLSSKILKKEANLNKISKSIDKLNIKKLNMIILCDFASTVLNNDYISKSESYFTNKYNLPCINIVSPTINFIKKRTKGLSIISPYNKEVTTKFINLLPKKNLIKSISNFSYKSEEEIDNNYSSLKSLKINKFRNDILFIGGGVSVSHFVRDYQKNMVIKYTHHH